MNSEGLKDIYGEEGGSEKQGHVHVANSCAQEFGMLKEKASFIHVVGGLALGPVASQVFSQPVHKPPETRKLCGILVAAV